MAWGAVIGAAGGILGGILGQPNYKVGQYSTMTPAQQASYEAMLKQLSNFNPNYVGESSYNPQSFQGGYNPTQYQGGYNPTQFQGGYSPYQDQYQSQMQGALSGALSGQLSTNINQQTTEDYYRQAIERPAMRQYEEEVRPAWMQQTSNIHSSARDTQEQKGYENLFSNLQSQRAGLMYQDEQARRGLAESAAQRQLSGLQTAAGMSQAEQQQALAGQQLGQQAWATQNQLGLNAADQAQQAWYNQNQLGLSSNQQNMQAWQAYQQNLLGADQSRLAYQQAMLQQSALPYQLGIQALGIPGMENVAYPEGGGGLGQFEKYLPGANWRGLAGFGATGGSSFLPSGVTDNWF